MKKTLFLIMILVLTSSCTCEALDLVKLQEIAVSNLRNEQYDKAIVNYTTLINANPKSESNYFNRAQAYELTGNYQKAIADYTMSIKLKPLNPDSYARRGLSKIFIDEIDSGVSDINNAKSQCTQMQGNACLEYNMVVDVIKSLCK